MSKPYLLFVGDAPSEPVAKTAFGVRDWLPGDVVGQLRLPGCGVDLGLPDLSPTQARDAGAKSMLLGIAPIGGAIPDSWIPSLAAALEAGLDLVSGLHTRLAELIPVRRAAERLGRTLHDVRHVRGTFPVANGRRRSGKRLLTVGTDCALGKKYTALALTNAMLARGVKATFRATGQTGIMIAGEGIPIDSVVADFVAGAAECLSPDAAPDHWDVIEGQGALFHPAYAGVCLGLLHGSQPDALVVCHDPLRETLNGYPDYPLPSLPVAMSRYLEAAQLTNPDVCVVGISLNTSHMRPDAAQSLMSALEAEHSLPCFDPLRSDLNPAVDRLLSATAATSAARAREVEVSRG
ncbi:MAG: DUF1611 domain-containing protein [Phenylobacterium sp.]|nr:MAG: DUF1611 domain-containing protein [Phenylobacterium sp.]